MFKALLLSLSAVSCVVCHAQAQDDWLEKQIDPTLLYKKETAQPQSFAMPQVRQQPVVTVKMENGPGSVPVLMSATEPNLIVLPFINPYVVGNEALHVEKRAKSNKIYVSFSGRWPLAPRQLFIEDSEGRAVISFELQPKDIGSQTVIVEGASYASASDKRLDRSNGFLQYAQIVLQRIAKDSETPPGFSVQSIEDQEQILKGGVLFKSLRKYSSMEYEVIVYIAENVSQINQELHEKQLDDKGVVAVSIFPAHVITPGQTTTVLVMRRSVGG